MKVHVSDHAFSIRGGRYVPFSCGLYLDPSCCGILKMQGLTANSLAGIKEVNSKTIQECKHLPRKGLLQAETNSFMENHNKWLKALGFRVVTKFYNPNSFRYVSVWHYKINQKRK